MKTVLRNILLTILLISNLSAMNRGSEEELGNATTVAVTEFSVGSNWAVELQRILHEGLLEQEIAHTGPNVANSFFVDKSGKPVAHSY